MSINSTFDDYLCYIQNDLGYKLLPTQIEFLRRCCEDKDMRVYWSRGSNKTYWMQVYAILQDIERNCLKCKKEN